MQSVYVVLKLNPMGVKILAVFNFKKLWKTIVKWKGVLFSE
ncbi:hypothetical protein HMPREF9372_2532 [Sporosarcina newyorkensis 2681]|uniref:Uncharacterized protein n=1 Tax=Sporosarcina newyorkensis 2681 TaxID=1027292 RepID=F9DUQ1_9BACL|nr:hypothetical protein HMPREF9372_2532 [Sporosarcina newyorkensis 2681]